MFSNLFKRSKKKSGYEEYQKRSKKDKSNIKRIEEKLAQVEKRKN